MISVLVVMVAVAAPDLKLEKPDAIDGDWQAVSVSMGGMAIPEELASGMRFHFNKGTLTAIMAINNNQEATEKAQKIVYKLDALKQPAQIDMTPTEGPDKDQTTFGIFKVKGDELTLCMSMAGQARPGKFETADPKIAVFVFKRIKK